MRTSDAMVQGLLMDMFPEGQAAWIDFGMDKRNAKDLFGALQYGWRHEVFTEDDIHAASCSGPMITALVEKAVAAGSVWGRGLVVKTAWDDLPEDMGEHNGCDEDDEEE